MESIEDEAKIVQEAKAEEKVLPFFTSQPGEYYYYRAYFDEEITKEMTPQTTKDWMTVTWNDGALLVRFDNEWETEEREYVKDGDNHYVYRTYLDDSGCVYEFPLEFYGNGTVGVFSYDGLEWSMYKKQ